MNLPIDLIPLSSSGAVPFMLPRVDGPVAAKPRAQAIQPESQFVWGLPFVKVTTRESIDWIESLVDQAVPSYVITANLNWVMLSHQQVELSTINANAAGIVADGMPIIWQSRRVHGVDALPERVAGSEMIYLLAERAAARGWSIYFTGGAEGVAETAAKRLAAMYPGLRIAGYDCPPFRKLTQSEEAEHLDRIRRSEPQLLFVAFGQPKGETWIHRHYNELGVPVSIQLGASFDFVAGTAKRAPLFWQRLGLEWAYRTASDPRRLLPRYWANAKFLLRAHAKYRHPL